MTFRFAFVAAVVALISTFFPEASLAQTGPLVKEIEIQYAGPATVSRERILANMRTAVGRPYSQPVVEEDIRTLYGTGNITNLRIFGEPADDGVKVVVVVQTKATVSAVRVEGAEKVKTARVRKEITAKPGEALNEATLEQDRQKIAEYYRNRGFSDTDVQYSVNVNEATGTADVAFTVNEGGKTEIRRVEFEGNTVFTDRELRKVVSTRNKNWLSFLTKTGRVQNEQLDQDVLALREHYQNAGYIDVDVQHSVVAGSGKGVDVVFTVREGLKYTVGAVEVIGPQVFTPDEIRSRLKLLPGGAFSPKVVRDDVKAIQDAYGARGYIDLQVTPETRGGAGETVNVIYSLEEGSQSYVERVEIEGNTRTKDKVIRRELAVAPGDVYNTVLVDASRARLQNLNYFSRIDAYPSETIVPGRKDLNVIVEEKQTGSFNFGAGFSSIDNLLGFVEVQQSNFDITRWPSFTGGGQRFRTRVQYGTKRKDFVIALTEPWFMDYQLAVGGELFFREASFVSSVYSQRNYGFALNARKALTNFLSVRLDYRLENIAVFDVDEDASQIFQDEEGERLKSSISATIGYDSRDSIFLTRRGQRVNLTTYAAGGPLGGDTQIYGFDLEGSQYFPLLWDTILILNGQVASVDTWGSGTRVPIFDRLYLGGSNDLRGFRYREVGPKDEDGEPIGGGTLARFTVEYTFPVVERVRGAIFYDVGYVNSGAFQFSPSDINSDVGIGVRLELPIGPVRIDYGIPIQADQFNDSAGRFNFNIGYQF